MPSLTTTPREPSGDTEEGRGPPPPPSRCAPAAPLAVPRRLTSGEARIEAAPVVVVVRAGRAEMPTRGSGTAGREGNAPYGADVTLAGCAAAAPAPAVGAEKGISAPAVPPPNSEGVEEAPPNSEGEVLAPNSEGVEENKDGEVPAAEGKPLPPNKLGAARGVQGEGRGGANIMMTYIDS